MGQMVLERVVEEGGIIRTNIVTGKTVRIVEVDLEAEAERRAALKDLFARNDAFRAQHPETVRSGEQILSDLRAERDSWD